MQLARLIQRDEVINTILTGSFIMPLHLFNLLPYIYGCHCLEIDK